jgi:hypothetical protein
MGRRAPSTVSTVSTQAICRSRQPLDEIAYCNSINALDRGNRWQEAIQQLQDMDSYSFLDWKVFFPWFYGPCVRYKVTILIPTSNTSSSALSTSMPGAGGEGTT